MDSFRITHGRGRRKGRSTSRRGDGRDRAAVEAHFVCGLEPLESRQLLSVGLAPITATTPTTPLPPPPTPTGPAEVSVARSERPFPTTRRTR